MKTNLYTKYGAVAVALAMSAAPALAFAEAGEGGEGGARIQANTAVQTQQVAQTSVTAGARPSIQGGTEEMSEGAQVRTQESAQVQAGTKPSIQGGEAGEGHDIGAAMERELSGFDDDAPVGTIQALQQKIQTQTQALREAVASTTSTAEQDLLQRSGESKIAANSLAASKNLLGNVGQQVSEIAKQVGASVATTTAAEAQIQSRGFLTRLLFGGDSAAANAIDQEVTQNQQRIQELQQLLTQAGVSATVQATLTTQIQALQDAQTRLQDLAKQEKGAWGLFSWRFF